MSKPIPVYPYPRTRRDCLPGGINASRPCPWSACRHHMDGAESCVLDVVDENPDGVPIRETAEALGVSEPVIVQDEYTGLIRAGKGLRKAGVR